MSNRMRLVSIIILPAVLAFAGTATPLVCADTDLVAPAIQRLPPPGCHSFDGPCGTPAVEPVACIRPEQRNIEYRDSASLCRDPMPLVERPVSVQHPGNDRPGYYLSLDEVILLALQNADVIRVVGGTFTTSSGSTVYDPAIVNTQIDQARGRFDPVMQTQNLFGRTETPFGVLDALDPNGSRIEGLGVDSYSLNSEISQVKPNGGTARLGFRTNPTRTGEPFSPLDPQTPMSLDLSYSQPLLRGRGIDVNQAPIVIARIDTERSVYQLKDATQELVRSIIESYWGIVFARTDIWARQQQIEQLQFAYDFFESQRLAGRADIGDSSPAKVSLASFQAALIAAQADLINREEALIAGLGLPPGSPVHIIPSTPPIVDRRSYDLDQLLEQAEESRPDLVERKLALEANYQRLLVAENDVLPQVDATALYRLNGLSGETPTGANISAGLGEFRDWQAGVGFAMPLGQRTNRAVLREVEMLLARDRTNLKQQILEATHAIARHLRNLDQFYAQYQAFRSVREAARINLDRQFQLFRVGGLPTEQITYLNVLLAVTDWGNAVSGEAQAICQYNAELAALSRAVGTILEEHGVSFLEAQYESIGPKLLGPYQCYPEAMPPSNPVPEYNDTGKAAEQIFELVTPVPKSGRSQSGDDSEPLPAPKPPVRPAVPIQR